MISKIHLGLPNAYKLICFGRNINGNKDVKFLGCDYLLAQWCVIITLESLLALIFNICMKYTRCYAISRPKLNYGCYLTFEFTF